MKRAPKICSHRNCPNVQPCPDHTPAPWASSRRRERTVSGSRQQKRARFVMYRDQAICHVCGEAGADQVDHVVSLGEGGLDDVSNLAPIHKKSCHEAKSLAEARRARGAA